MQIIKISEALKEIGKPISGISGVVKAAFKARTGVGQYGPWIMQDVVIKDETGEISATFSGMDDLKARIGSRVTLTSTLVKGVMKGLAVIQDEWIDKKTGQPKKAVKLKMDKDCFIDWGTTPVSDSQPGTTPLDAAKYYPHNTSAVPSDVEDEEAQALRILEEAKRKKAERLEREAREKAAQESSSNPKRSSGVGRINQITNLYSLAVRRAKMVLESNDIALEQFTESVATLFIAYRDDGLTDTMSVNFFEEIGEPVSDVIDNRGFTPPPAQEPSPEIDQEPKTWQEVEVDGIKLGDMLPSDVEELFNSFKPKIDPKTGTYGIKDLYIKGALMNWKKERL